MNLIYIIGTYPLLTTTFIDREIKSLRRQGFDLQVVAMRRPDAGTPLSGDQQALQQGVTYLLPVKWGRLLGSHLYFILKRPLRYFQTLLYLLTRPHPGHHARFKTFLHFGQGVYTAYLVRKRPIHELHAHFVDRAATVALVAGRLLDRPYSLSIHAAADIFVNPILLPEKISEARHVVTCTLYNKAHLETLTGHKLNGKVSHVLHGLDLTRYRPMPRPDTAPPLILSVGQLVERKGFVQLIYACRSLRDRGHIFRCHIVGRGPQREALQDLIAQLALEDTVTLTGALPHEEVIEQYQQATMFVLPCLQTKEGDVDGIPNVLPEAMAMQLPVISTAVSAIPELVQDKINGLLAPPGDHPALVAAMECLLKDAARREELGKMARRRVLESFDVECNVRRFAAVLWPDLLEVNQGHVNDR